jgi:hypothetical protein
MTEHSVCTLQPVSSVFLYFFSKQKLYLVLLQSLCLLYDLSKCILLFSHTYFVSAAAVILPVLENFKKNSQVFSFDLNWMVLMLC